MNELLLCVFLWIVLGKFVLVQPATPVDNGNIQHFSAARHGRVCAISNFRAVNSLADFFNDVRERELYSCALLDGIGVAGTGTSRSRDLRRRCGSLQDGYGSDRS